jgi:hypothetical protein
MQIRLPQHRGAGFFLFIAAIAGKCGFDLHEAAVAVAVAAGHALGQRDLVVDAHKLSGMHCASAPG